MTEPLRAVTYGRYTLKGREAVEKAVIREVGCTLFVNGLEWVTLMCTPGKLEALALGFLLSEGVITGLDDVASLRVCREDPGVVDVWLNYDVVRPEKRVLTAGCGGGVTFDVVAKAHARLNSGLRVTPDQVLALTKQLNAQAELYPQAGGVHTSALSDGRRLLVMAEDVGRHNTLDKIRGECLLRGISTVHCILLTTGRISSEMLSKAVKMGVPVVVSRSSPTDLSLRLAEAWGITVIGYVRASKMHVYTWEERVCLPSEDQPMALSRPAVLRSDSGTARAAEVRPQASWAVTSPD